MSFFFFFSECSHFCFNFLANLVTVSLGTETRFGPVHLDLFKLLFSLRFLTVHFAVYIFFATGMYNFILHICCYSAHSLDNSPKFTTLG